MRDRIVNHMNILEYKISFYTTSVLGLIFLFFMISTFITFFKKKKRLNLYLGFHYLSFILAWLFSAIVSYTAIQSESIPDFYDSVTMFANIFVIIGIISLIFFYREFVEVKLNRKIAEIVIGLLIIVWIILPFNYIVGSSSGFQLKYLTYIFVSLYGILIYIGMAISFFRMSTTTLKGSREKKQMLFLSIGSVIFVEYFFIIAAFGILQIFMLLFIGLYSLAVSFFCYFLGIYLPKFRKA